MTAAQTATAATTRSLPVLFILGAVLIVLKALGKIDWSWFWVLTPFWAPWAILIAVCAVLLIGAGVFIVGAALIGHFRS